MNNLDRIFKEDRGIEAFAKNYLGYVGEVLSRIDSKEI